MLRQEQIERLPKLMQIWELASEIIDAKLELEIMNAMRGINEPIDPLPWWVVEVLKTFEKKDDE
tara:strand:- start:812 stop:1003 length:192 start_codon:yes stop_codon:yes gene_type:complete